MTVAALLEANPNVRNADRIFPGQELRVPNGPAPRPAPLLADDVDDVDVDVRDRSGAVRSLNVPRRRPEIAVNVAAIQRMTLVADARARAASPGGAMHAMTNDAAGIEQELGSPMSAPPPAIDVKHEELGGAGGVLGAPTHPEERATADGVGRYKDYEQGSIYWTPQTGERTRCTAPCAGVGQSSVSSAGLAIP